jgi:hypothetical protein
MEAFGYPDLPKAGVVPDGTTAERMAVAVWTAMYGEESVAAQTPAKSELRQNVWVVRGSAGGDAALFAFILQSDGRFLSLGRGAPTT